MFFWALPTGIYGYFVSGRSIINFVEKPAFSALEMGIGTYIFYFSSVSLYRAEMSAKLTFYKLIKNVYCTREDTVVPELWGGGSTVSSRVQ